MTNIDICTAVAFSYLRVPYIWGGDSDKGLDCSGLVQLIFEPVGLDPNGDQTAQAFTTITKQKKRM